MNGKYERNRVLALYNVLSRNTDEEHPMNMAQIREEMKRSGNSCSEDSIFRYMKQLRNELGVDIISSKGRNANYFIGKRVLDKEEMQVVIDAINASSVIDEISTKRIIEKIKGLTSIYISGSLDRNILSAKNGAREKKNTLYRISEIQNALDEDCQISFEYVDWNTNKKMNQTGKTYTISPWGLIWANDRYYLYGYVERGDDNHLEERTFRIDKLRSVRKINKTRRGKLEFKSFNVFNYVSRRIDMYSSIEKKITVRTPRKYVGIFIDRFGDKIHIQEINDKYIEITFDVACSNYFYGWLLGIGDTMIVTPAKVKKEMQDFLRECIENYEK